MPRQSVLPSSLWRQSNCMPMHIPKTGCFRFLITSSSPRSWRYCMVLPASPCPGNTTLSELFRTAGSSVMIGSAPSLRSALSTERMLPALYFTIDICIICCKVTNKKWYTADWKTIFWQSRTYIRTFYHKLKSEHIFCFVQSDTFRFVCWCLFLWSWRGLNPRPNKEAMCFLHAYFSFGFRAATRPELPRRNLILCEFHQGCEAIDDYSWICCAACLTVSGRELSGRRLVPMSNKGIKLTYCASVYAARAKVLLPDKLYDAVIKEPIINALHAYTPPRLAVKSMSAPWEVWCCPPLVWPRWTDVFWHLILMYRCMDPFRHQTLILWVCLHGVTNQCRG